MSKLTYLQASHIVQASPRMKAAHTHAMDLAGIKSKSETGKRCLYAGAHLFESGFLDRMELHAGLCGGWSYKHIRSVLVKSCKDELIAQGYFPAYVLWWIFSPLIRAWIGHLIDQWLIQDAASLMIAEQEQERRDDEAGRNEG